MRFRNTFASSGLSVDWAPGDLDEQYIEGGRQPVAHAGATTTPASSAPASRARTIQASAHASEPAGEGDRCAGVYGGQGLWRSGGRAMKSSGSSEAA